MAICITDSCRGYPLFKKNEQLYYLNQSGEEIPFIQSANYIDGDLEECKVISGDNTVTYYRVPKCKGDALFHEYSCIVGCDLNRYPYTYHPGNTAGVVEKCITAEQTYYGYSSCNKGWVGGWNNGGTESGKCKFATCSMNDYPYLVEPKKHYGEREDRGKTAFCNIGGATYYRYTECNSDFELRGKNAGSIYSICARKCEITECSNTPFTYTYPNGDTAQVNNWSCKLDNRCKAGDIAIYKGKDIGIIGSINEKTIRIISYPYSIDGRWGIGDDANTIDIPHLKNGDTTTSGKIQTQGMMLFKKQKADEGKAYVFPIAEGCYNYDIGCEEDELRAKGE